jgi:hypothetical protein
MNGEQNDNPDNQKAKLDLVSVLLDKRNAILKKYRKKFEELKINNLKGKLLDSKNEHE